MRGLDRVILRLLEAQKNALLSGDLPNACARAGDLDRLIARLDPSGAQAQDIDHILTRARENARLIAAAQKGLAAAIAMVNRKAETTFAAYDAKGRRQGIAPNSGSRAV